MLRNGRRREGDNRFFLNFYNGYQSEMFVNIMNIFCVLAVENTGMHLFREKIDKIGLVSTNKVNILLYKYRKKLFAQKIIECSSL